MNKAISWKKDEHFSGGGKEYICTNAYVKYESAMVGVVDDNGKNIEIDINDNDFNFIFDNNIRPNETNKIIENNCKIMNNTTWDSTIGDGGMLIKTPEKLLSFFYDIEKIYKKYGLSIEATHAGFSIREYNEIDMEILRAASKNFK